MSLFLICYKPYPSMPADQQTESERFSSYSIHELNEENHTGQVLIVYKYDEVYMDDDNEIDNVCVWKMLDILKNCQDRMI